MSTTLLEHRVALAHAEDPFGKREQHKAIALIRRLRWLQWQDDKSRSNPMAEGERAALLWALRDLGVICGRRTARRTNAADLRCVRPAEHGGECDDRLGADK